MSLASDDVRVDVLQNAATANGNGTISNSRSALGYGMVLEIQETAGGTATIALQGSFDGTQWYAVGYELIDNTAAPARAVANISVTADMVHSYAVLDVYPQTRAVLSAVAGGATVTVRLLRRN